MVHLTYLSLFTEGQKVFELSRKYPTKKGTAFSIDLVKFDPKEILHPPEEVRFHVAYGKVLFRAFSNNPHARGHGCIRDCLFRGFEDHFGRRSTTIVPNLTLRVVNINEGRVVFGKECDGDISLRDSKYNYPTVVVEIGATQDDMDLLLREAEVYLNQETDIQYVILLNIEFNQQRVESLRLLLCLRLKMKS